MSKETAAQAVARRARERAAIEEREAAMRKTMRSVAEGGRRVVGVSREALMSADAAVRGAANVLTLNKADVIAAGLDAALQRGGRSVAARFRANLGQQQARDRYDAVHRPVARTTGQVLGAVAPMGLLGRASSVAGMAPRLSGVALQTRRELAAATGMGGAVGLAAQHYADLLTNGRPSLVNDLGGALGGAVGVRALPLGPARAGAIGSAATTVTQDLLNRRIPSVEHVGHSAVLGNLFGGLGGAIGRADSNGLSSLEKGRLGERLGAIRSSINGMPRELGRKSRDYIAGTPKYWYPDGRYQSKRFEDKFGYRAELKPNQVLAQRILGPDFVLNHFTPDDIGKIFSVPAASAAPHVNDAKSRR